MNLLQLVRRNAWRKPLRTLLLVFCVAIAFLIYGLTTSLMNGTQGSAGASDDLLGVMNAGGRTVPLPMAYLSRITSEPGVAAVAYIARLRGYVNVEKNVVSISAGDPRLIGKVNGKELALTPELLSAFGQTRDRVLVGRALAQAQGWTIGQRITVTSLQTVRKDGSHDWQFEIAGIFDGQSSSTDTYFVLANYNYVNAMRARGVDTADAFVVLPAEGVSPAVLSTRIDNIFAASAISTRTQSEKQFLEAFLRQYADVGLIINLVVGAAFVALLMIVVNTMVFAVRERSFEIGVLKALGFSGDRILVFILSETLLIFVIGGGIGLVLAEAATVLAGPALGLVLSTRDLLEAALFAAALGLLTGLLPAINAMRIPVTAAFRRR